MSNPSDERHDAEDENENDEQEYEREQEQDIVDEHDDDSDSDDDELDGDEADDEDDGDDLSEVPELRSCLGALMAAIAFWLGLALTALCFCAVFAMALRCV
jgi:hypothetical protein